MNDEAKTVNNYYGMTFLNCSMPNATFQTINQAPCDDEAGIDPEVEEATAEVAVPAPVLPADLQSSESRRLLERMVAAGLLDERWQPLGLSHAKRGLLAKELADRLCVAYPWTTFGRLWGMKPETLRAAYHRAMDQRQALEFIELLKGVV